MAITGHVYELLCYDHLVLSGNISLQLPEHSPPARSSKALRLGKSMRHMAIHSSSSAPADSFAALNHHKAPLSYHPHRFVLQGSSATAPPPQCRLLCPHCSVLDWYLYVGEGKGDTLYRLDIYTPLIASEWTRAQLQIPVRAQSSKSKKFAIIHKQLPLERS